MVELYELRYSCAASDIGSNEFTRRNLRKMTKAVCYFSKNSLGPKDTKRGESKAWEMDSNCRVGVVPVEEPYDKNFRLLLRSPEKESLVSLAESAGLWNGGNGIREVRPLAS